MPCQLPSSIQVTMQPLSTRSDEGGRTCSLSASIVPLSPSPDCHSSCTPNPCACAFAPPVRRAARAVGQAVQAEDLAGAAELHERHFLGFARLEAHRGAGGMSRCMPKAVLAIEIQRLVHFEKMEVAADLDRTVAGVDGFDRDLRGGRH